MPPDPHRLALLTDLRKTAGLTLADMARVCGLHGQQSHQTAGAWEMGRMIPEESRRRQAFMHYLWDELGLRRDPARFEETWIVLVEEWGWEELHDREWQRLTHAPRPTKPASSTVAPTRLAPFQAPALTPHFVGRGREIDEFASWLADVAASRPAALVGMGGVGKSTLAAQIAHRLRNDFPDGVLWAHLADADPLDILQGWAQVFGCDFRSLTDVENRAAAVRGLWSGKRVLIVLDDARTLECLRPLLPGSPTCAALITTRDRELAALVNAQIMPLGELPSEESSALLVRLVGGERVRAEPEATRRIGQIVEHLPLALEIVGRLLARAEWQSLTEMADRLADASQRLDRLVIRDVSVRAAFLVSWQSLPADLRRVFALLGLFQARSFASPALAAAANLPIDQAEEGLLELASLSLLGVEAPRRFRQHALLADFAREQLGEPGAAQFRLADYYLGFVQASQSTPVAADVEMENLMAVVAAMHGAGDWDRVMRLVDELHPAWLHLARYGDARRGYGWGMDAAANLGDESARAQMLIRLGFVCNEQGDFEEAEGCLRAGLIAARQLNEATLTADAQFHLARIMLERGELEEVDELLGDCLRIRAESGDEIGVAAALRERGLLYYRHGGYATTDALCRQALAIHEAHNDTPGILSALRLLADIAMEGKNLDEALDFGNRALRLAQLAGLPAETAEAHYTLASIHRLRRTLDEALAHCERAAPIFERCGNRSFVAYTRYEQSVILSLRDRDVESLALAQEAHDLQEALGDIYGRVTTLLHLGDLHKKHGDLAQAGATWRQGMRLAREIRYPYVESFVDRLAALGGAAYRTPGNQPGG